LHTANDLNLFNNPFDCYTNSLFAADFHHRVVPKDEQRNNGHHAHNRVNYRSKHVIMFRFHWENFYRSDSNAINKLLAEPTADVRFSQLQPAVTNESLNTACDGALQEFKRQAPEAMELVEPTAVAEPEIVLASTQARPIAADGAETQSEDNASDNEAGDQEDEAEAAAAAAKELATRSSGKSGCCCLMRRLRQIADNDQLEPSEDAVMAPERAFQQQPSSQRNL